MKAILVSFALVLSAACRSSESVTNQSTTVSNTTATPAPTATAAATTATPTATPEPANMNTSGDDPAAKSLQPELLEVKRAFLRSVFSGDRQGVAALLADDFKITRPDGLVRNKEQYLAELQPLEGLETFLVPEARVKSLKDDTAVMTCLVQARVKGKDFSEQFTDTFVKKDGRWLLQSVESKEVK